jgi:hypothetical protein
VPPHEFPFMKFSIAVLFPWYSTINSVTIRAFLCRTIRSVKLESPSAIPKFERSFAHILSDAGDVIFLILHPAFINRWSPITSSLVHSYNFPAQQSQPSFRVPISHTRFEPSTSQAPVTSFTTRSKLPNGEEKIVTNIS